MHDIKSITEQNAPTTSLAISMAMRIKWFSAKHITQYIRSRAPLDATGCHHLVSIRQHVLPQQTPWSLILASKIKLWHCEIGMKWTLYSAHWSNKHRRKVEHHNLSSGLVGKWPIFQMGHMTNLSTRIHSSIPQYGISKVLFKKLSGRYPLGVSKLTFCSSGSVSGLKFWFLVGFGVIESLQVNANDTFAT